MNMEVCGHALHRVIWHAGGRTEKIATKNSIQDYQCLDLNEVPSEDTCKVTTTPACLIIFLKLCMCRVDRIYSIYVQQMLKLK